MHVLYLITVQVIYDMARQQRDFIVSIFNNLRGWYDRAKEEINKKRKPKVVEQVQHCYSQNAYASAEFQYLFDGDVGDQEDN